MSGCASAPKATTAALPQQPIPASLVSALLDYRFGSTTASKLSVAAVPDGYPASLIPGAPAKIVGGMTSGTELYAIFEDSTRRLAAILEDVFTSQGFAKPTPRPASGFSAGFTNSGMFCGDSAGVSVESLGGDQRHMARVTYRKGYRRSFCTGQFTEEPTQVRLKIPALTLPPGARSNGSGGGDGSNGVNSRLELTGTGLTPSSVATHYTTQLVAAGWKPSAPATSEQVVSQYFEANDPSGALWTGTLTAEKYGSGIAVVINMRPRPRR